MIRIALDGPAGSGKSTIAKMLAEHLGFVYLDTGALYRAVALYAIETGTDTKNPKAVISILPYIKVELGHTESGEQIVYLNGRDVSSRIRMPDVSSKSSDVSSIPQVRKFLLEIQRNIGKSNNVIMDGRDIGTVVIPDAEIKIFLTARLEDRAERRYKELMEKGADVSLEKILEDVRMRDERDINRETAPLKMADDAVLVDTSAFTLEESFDIVKSIVENKIQQGF